MQSGRDRCLTGDRPKRTQLRDDLEEASGEQTSHGCSGSAMPGEFRRRTQSSSRNRRPAMKSKAKVHATLQQLQAAAHRQAETRFSANLCGIRPPIPTAAVRPAEIIRNSQRAERVALQVPADLASFRLPCGKELPRRAPVCRSEHKLYVFAEAQS